jgi:Lipoxygenase
MAPSKKHLSDKENLKAKRKRYQWSTRNGFPPHLSVIPPKDAAHKMNIFKKDRWDKVQLEKLPESIAQFFGADALVPNPATGKLRPNAMVTMDMIEKKYKDLYETAQASAGKIGDVYTSKHIGLREDWFTDAVFAQQQFTGVNPTGLKQASKDWMESFAWAATDQDNEEAQELLANPASSFYVVDNSDYRYLLGLKPDQELSALGPNTERGALPAYGAASVTLFSLSDSGRLHPVAICLDYLSDMSDSVTIFNRRLTPDAQGVDEATDWSWRYAKMCSSMSDWTRHELAIHLTETHLLEEPIIIAAQRSFPDSHIICHILRPHWYKTLSLNYLARARLVPDFIEKVAPLKVCVVHFSYAMTPNDLLTARPSQGLHPAFLFQL